MEVRGKFRLVFPEVECNRRPRDRPFKGNQRQTAQLRFLSNGTGNPQRDGISFPWLEGVDCIEDERLTSCKTCDTREEGRWQSTRSLGFRAMGLEGKF